MDGYVYILYRYKPVRQLKPRESPNRNLEIAYSSLLIFCCSHVKVVPVLQQRIGTYQVHSVLLRFGIVVCW